mgnify:CR=1 FL=1
MIIFEVKYRKTKRRLLRMKKAKSIFAVMLAVIMAVCMIPFVSALEVGAGELAVCVAGGDVKSITAAQGVGPKIAQRIVLELKGKLDIFATTSEQMGNIAAAQKATVSYAGEDAVNALVMLGYSKSEASIAVGRLDGNLSTE